MLAGLVEAPAGHEDAIESLVPGELVGSWAVYQPTRPFAPQVCATTATRTDSGYRIDGVKDRVEAGPQSDLLLVTADCDGRIRQFLTPADSPGVSVTPQRSVDMVKRHARVQFDRVEVTESAVVGTAEQTPDIIERQREVALVLQCAEVVGILDAVLFHERRAVGGGSAFASGTGAENASEMPPDHVGLAEATGQADDAGVQELGGRALVRGQ